MKNHIVIISCGQPSTNPRALKEALAFLEHGYSVSFIYNYWVYWGLKIDDDLKKKYPEIKWICVGGDPYNAKLIYILTRIRYKFYKVLAGIFSSSLYWVERASSRCFPELLEAAKMNKAGLYIGHTLGALPVAANAAVYNNSLYAFDAEDYHRGQSVLGSNENEEVKLIEDKYLRQASYFSAASPLIAKKYNAHYNFLIPLVINNVFSSKYLQIPLNYYHENKILRLFWFSQTVNKNRGLEEVIEVLIRLKDLPLSFTILGNASDDEKKRLTSLAMGVEDKLKFVSPVPENEIFSIAGNHHIGFALETEKTINRDICLTNKIFTYLLSGLAVVASNTSAQKNFLADNSGIGEIFDINNINELEEIIFNLYNNPSLLNAMRKSSLKLAADRFNWEIEQKPLINKIGELLNT